MRAGIALGSIFVVSIVMGDFFVVKVMSGGGSLLRNIDKLLTQVTGVPCHVAENSLNCVALGTGLALEHFDFFKKSLVSQV